jgi:hypothetical protein
MPTGRLSIGRALVFTATLLALAMATALMIRPGSARVSRLPASDNEARAYEQTGAVTDAAPILRVWVHPDDIYPDLVRTKPGRVILMAENERTTDISLVVARLIFGQSNQTVASISVSNIAKRAGNVLDLSAGTYIFYEQTRPDLTGTIIVAP